MKELDLKKSVYELTETYPELVDLLKEIGFLGVVRPIVRNTIGRVTTIPMGSQKMGLDIKEVIMKLEQAGYTVKS